MCGLPVEIAQQSLVRIYLLAGRTWCSVACWRAEGDCQRGKHLSRMMCLVKIRMLPMLGVVRDSLYHYCNVANVTGVLREVGAWLLVERV